MAEETTNSNAVMESSYSSAVGGVRTSTNSTGLVILTSSLDLKLLLLKYH